MSRRAALLPILLLLAGPPGARAQGDECNTVDLPGVNEQYQQIGSTITVEGPFLVRCANGAELRAQRGTLDELAGELLLVGNVDYRDAERTLTAAQATYTSSIRRLYATGDVVFHNNTEGMSIRGPELEYFAEMEGRPQAQVNAGSRPHLTIRPRGEPDGDPLEIDADRVTILGQNDLSAFGSVVIHRPDLEATASEARFNGETESLELRQNAVIEGRDNVLRGEVIQARMENDVLQEVRARTGAVLEAEDLTVNAPDVQLFFRDELVERTVARRGPETDAAQPVAVSKTFRLVADSIDALAPAQKLDRVIAIGSARGESIDTMQAAPVSDAPADTAAAAPEATADEATRALIGSDWIVGDTIIGFFTTPDSATVSEDGEPGDTSAVLERITARGAAQSLYRNEKQTADGAPPEPGARRGLNFVSAETITLRFEDGQVDTAELAGVRRAIYLDPVATPAAAPPGSSPAPAQDAGQARE